VVGGPFDAEVLTGVNDPPQGGWLWVEQCLEFPNPNIGLPSLLDEQGPMLFGFCVILLLTLLFYSFGSIFLWLFCWLNKSPLLKFLSFFWLFIVVT